MKKLIDRLKNRASIENRSDDIDEKILQNRMDIYLKDTVKILKHYPKDIICNFNADQNKLEVIKDILIKFAAILG